MRVLEVFKSRKVENLIHWTAFGLIAIGGINWGMIGVRHSNPMALLFNFNPNVLNVLYIAIGFATLYIAYEVFFKKKQY